MSKRKDIDEAAQLAAALEQMSDGQFSGDSVLALLSAIWLKSFELSKEDMELRLPALRRVAHEIFDQSN